MSVLALTACATIDRGTIDHVRVDTVPQGAKATLIYIDDSRKGQKNGAMTIRVCPATPCAFEVSRKQHGIVRLEQDGYADFDYFVGPSSLRGSVGYDVSSTGTMLGTGALGGLYYAAVTQFAAGLTNVFTLGAANATGTSTATGIAGGTGVGLGLIAGSMIIDSATSAKKNIYPNPSVIRLADAGFETPDDPFVKAYIELVKSHKDRAKICAQKRQDQTPISCSQARVNYSKKYNALMTLKKGRDDEIQTLIKETQDEFEDAQRDLEQLTPSATDSLSDQGDDQ